MSLGDELAMAPRPLSKPEPPGFGTPVMFQVDPSKCIIRVRVTPLLVKEPETHRLFAATTSILESSSLATGGRSRGAQAVPSQWYSTAVDGLPKVEPRAQTSLLLAPLTVLNTWWVPSAGAGTSRWVHPVPSQCRVIGTSPGPFPDCPTAHTSLADSASTLSSRPLSPAGVGLGCRVQAVPSQCRIRVR